MLFVFQKFALLAMGPELIAFVTVEIFETDTKRLVVHAHCIPF
jgi:hypothetical protein